MTIVEILNEGSQKGIAKKSKMTDAERAEFEARCEMFYGNIALLFANIEKILSEPRLYSIKAPETLYEVMYVSLGERVITLGELLLLWQNEKAFSGTCPKCKGKTLLYRFGGSPLSGTIFESKSKCLECGQIDNEKKGGSFGSLRSIRDKYAPIEPVVEHPASVAELIDILNGVKTVADLDDDEWQPETVASGAEPTVIFGGHEMSNEQFMGMLMGVAPESSGLPPLVPTDEIQVTDGQKIKRFDQIEGSWRKIFDSTPPQYRFYHGKKEEALIMEKYHEGTMMGIDECEYDEDGETSSSYMPGTCNETGEGLALYNTLCDVTLSADGQRLQFVFSDDGSIEIYERAPEGRYRKFLSNSWRNGSMSAMRAKQS